MYTYTQLLARNTLYSLVVFLLLAAAIIITFQNFINNQHNNNSKSIKAITTNALVQNDVKSLAKILRKTNDYQLLNISTHNSENLYHYENYDSGILTYFIVAKKHTTTLSGIIITYQLSVHHISILILNLLFYLVILTSIIVIVLSLVSRQQYLLLFENIGQLINQELHLVDKKVQPKTFKQSTMLHIPELSHGLAQIKSLVDKIKQESQALKEEVYIDQLTHLPNRNSFKLFFQKSFLVDNNIHFGVMLVTRCQELQTINRLHGYRSGDAYLCEVSEIIEKTASQYPNAKIYRLNSSDFASIIPSITLDEAEQYAQKLTYALNYYQQTSSLETIGYTGLVLFDQNKNISDLLASVDIAISLAQTKGVNAWFTQAETSLQEPSTTYGNQNWQHEITNIIQQQSITLLSQPILEQQKTQPIYNEVLVRFKNKEGMILPTTSLISMAEKLKSIVSIDRLIIEKVINKIIDNGRYSHSLGININSHSMLDDNFIIWLERLLMKELTITKHLVFEITELGLQQNIKVSKRFIDMIHRVGASITIEHFGMDLTSFKVLNELKPDFIKIDSSYTSDIINDKNNQHFIKIIVDLAHSLNIKVLVESIETLDEKYTFETLAVDGYQGYFIGNPQEI